MSDSPLPRDGRRVLYGRRRGRRLNLGRTRALDQMLPAVGFELPSDGTVIDPRALFASPPECVWLEVGFGNGEHLAALAMAHPDIGMIGAEPFINGVAMLMKQMAADDLQNIRVLMDDARPLIERLPDQSLNRVMALFSDPWPKPKHHRRRFIQPETLDALARVMIPGAELRLASDDPSLQDWLIERTWQHPCFEWLARRPDDWRIRPDDWPPTRYEQKAIAAGRRPIYLRFRRQ